MNEPPSRPGDCGQQNPSIVEQSLVPTMQIECGGGENRSVQETDEDFCLLEVPDSPERKRTSDNDPTYQQCATLIGFSKFLAVNPSLYGAGLMLVATF